MIPQYEQKGHSINLVKGESCAVEQGIRRVMVGCGWDPQHDRSSYPFDLDISCVLLDAEGHKPSDGHFIYFGCKTFRSDVVVYTGDNLTGDGDGDDERLLIDLGRMPDDVVQIDIFCNIYEGKKRAQCFGMISDCYIRVVDITEEYDLSPQGPLYRGTSYPEREFCRFRINDEAVHATCVMFGTLYKGRRGAHSNGPQQWSFHAVQKDISLGGLDAMLTSVSPPKKTLAMRHRDNGRSRDDDGQQQQGGVMQLWQRAGELVPMQAINTRETRFLVGALGVGSLLLNVVGVVPLACLALFVWLTVSSSSNDRSRQ
jgi:tellurium resistance protein TerD